MKKIYIEAELDVILFDKNDIIVTSGANDNPFSGEGDHDNDISGWW